MKGLKGSAAAAAAGDEYDDEEMAVKEEESKRKAAVAADTLFGPSTTVGGELKPEEWSTVLSAMKILSRFGIDGLVSSNRGEVFHVPSKFPTKNSTEQLSAWDVEAGNLLAGWITEGSSSGGSNLVTLPVPVVHMPAAPTLTAPSRAILEASLSKSWGKPIVLPRGPLDIFRPPSLSIDGVKNE
jgi:hypothetical protein